METILFIWQTLEDRPMLNLADICYGRITNGQMEARVITREVARNAFAQLRDMKAVHEDKLLELEEDICGLNLLPDFRAVVEAIMAVEVGEVDMRGVEFRFCEEEGCYMPIAHGYFHEDGVIIPKAFATMDDVFHLVEGCTLDNTLSAEQGIALLQQAHGLPVDEEHRAEMIAELPAEQRKLYDEANQSLPPILQTIMEMMQGAGQV